MNTLYCVCRDWSIAPSEIWGMTISEIAYEYEWRRPGSRADYAGGMTEGDIEAIREGSARLRQKLKEKRNGTTTT